MEPPIKLLDGIWFGIDDEWVGPATKFTSGYGHVKMNLPGRDGLEVSRTDFVPDGQRAVLVGLEFAAGDADQSFALKMDAHSELMGAYPWGETTPSQTDFNLEDSVAVEGDKLVFREKGTPPAANADPHDWAAVVGSTRTPTGSDTGADFRGPQDPPVICPASGPNTPDPPDRCDDTAYGKGKGGQLRYHVDVPAGGTTTVIYSDQLLSDVLVGYARQFSPINQQIEGRITLQGFARATQAAQQTTIDPLAAESCKLTSWWDQQTGGARCRGRSFSSTRKICPRAGTTSYRTSLSG